MTKILGIIPQRKGSKGLPGKGTIDLNGKAVIEYTLSSAKKASLIDKIIVSTDDDKVSSISSKWDVDVVNRPPEIAQDDTPMIDVIKHSIEYFKNKGEIFDTVVLLQPTSPLRKNDDINKAITQFKDKDAKSLISMGEVSHENPYISFTINNGIIEPFLKEKNNFTRRQELPKVFFPYGLIFIAKTKDLLEKGSFYMENTIPYFIERWQCYEIDDIHDLKAIEAIMKYKNNEV
ncbi:cytidylyltransferase domain-containing protein [Nanoarchaeota archaeon]